MNKILSIVGPTATGKTDIALKIADFVLGKRDVLLDFKIAQIVQALSEFKYVGVDLISVDSRQVYKGLEILTGADVPEDFKQVLVKNQNLNMANNINSINNLGVTNNISSINSMSATDNHYAISTSEIFSMVFDFYKHQIKDITLHGISMIEPTQVWSVAHFKDFATKIIFYAFKNNRLPILVGGTGLYHKHLFNKDTNLYVPPNQSLRDKANKMSLIELQRWLAKINLVKLESMNNSDRNNPRRLIRAIEITVGKSKRELEIKSKTQVKTQIDENCFGLKFPENIEVVTISTIANTNDLELKNLQEKIKKRVQERFDNGAIKEVEKLLESYCVDYQKNSVNFKQSHTIDCFGDNCIKDCRLLNLPAYSTLGISDILDLILGKISAQDCVKNWSLHEFQYAKRQLTWFKK